MTVEFRIDPILCRGHAICALFFADGVDLDQWGFGKVVTGTAESARDIRRAHRAAAACPNGAFVMWPTGPGPATGDVATEAGVGGPLPVDTVR